MMPQAGRPEAVPGGPPGLTRTSGGGGPPAPGKWRMTLREGAESSAGDPYLYVQRADWEKSGLASELVAEEGLEPPTRGL